MKKIFFLILCVLMAVICFSTVNVFAEEVTDEIILDDFSYLNAQNWRINKKETENKVSIQTENGVLTVSSATAYAYTYYDVPIEVGADEDLIIEWDYIDSNGGDQYSVLSIMKGLRKTDDVMGFDKNAAAECVLSYINRVGESAAALNTILGAVGPAAEDLPEIRKIYALEKQLFASRYGNTHQELLEIYYEDAQVRIWGCTKECICYIDSQGQLWNCPLKKWPWNGRQMLPAEEDVCSLSIQCMTCLKRLTWQDELSGSGAPLLP